MKKRNRILINGVFLSGILLGNTIPAFALGEINPLSFQGNGSRVIDTGKPSIPRAVTIMAEDISSSANSTSSVTYSGNSGASTVSASATTSDYEFSGSLSASGNDKAWRTGGYFYDEISFSAATSGTYSIEFVFNINASAQLFTTTGRTDLTMTMSYWDGHRYRSLDTQRLLSISGNNLTGSVSGPYHLAMTGINYTNLNNSGSQTYLPYTIGLWGDAVNGSISWSNVALADVIVKDAAGNTLAPSSHTLQNDSIAFNAVTAPQDVPLPGAVWLLGFGFAGLAGLRGRTNSRLA